MDSQSSVPDRNEFECAQQELNQGNVLAALACLEKALSIEDDPHWHSCLGFCIAKERGHLSRAFELCQSSIAHDPGNPVHYYYLSKVHLIASNTYDALQTLHQGVTRGSSPEIERALVSFGARRIPVISSLPRSNPLNKYLGLTMARLGL